MLTAVVDRITGGASSSDRPHIDNGSSKGEASGSQTADSTSHGGSAKGAAALQASLPPVATKADKGKGGSKGSTPQGSKGGTPLGTPRGLGSSWGQAAPMQQSSKAPTVKTVLQDMQQTQVQHVTRKQEHCKERPIVQHNLCTSNQLPRAT